MILRQQYHRSGNPCRSSTSGRSGSSNPASSTCTESPLMLDTMRERMPGANVPLPYGGRVTGSNSLAYEGNDCAGRGAHAILSAPAPIKNLRLETPLDVTVLIVICWYLTFWLCLCPRCLRRPDVLFRFERKKLYSRSNATQTTRIKTLPIHLGQKVTGRCVG